MIETRAVSERWKTLERGLVDRAADRLVDWFFRDTDLADWQGRGVGYGHFQLGRRMFGKGGLNGHSIVVTSWATNIHVRDRGVEADITFTLAMSYSGLVRRNGVESLVGSTFNLDVETTQPYEIHVVNAHAFTLTKQEDKRLEGPLFDAIDELEVLLLTDAITVEQYALLEDQVYAVHRGGLVDA